MSTSISIPQRFCGPPETGNGGYTAGLLAQAVGAAPVEVTLRRPLPLNRPLAVEREGDLTVLRDGAELLAEARVVADDLDSPPAPIAYDEAGAAGACSPVVVHPEWHPAPTCFVCGNERDPDDALCLFPGPVRPGLFATTWTPLLDFGDDGGLVREEIVWAALDCPSSFLIYDGVDERPERFYVLGRMTARVDEKPRCGEPHVVQAWSLGSERRKLFACSAICDLSGKVLAVSRSTWIGI
jgi:hypothetical protein